MNGKRYRLLRGGNGPQHVEMYPFGCRIKVLQFKLVNRRDTVCLPQKLYLQFMSQSYDNVRVPVHSWVVTPYPGFVHQCNVYFFYLLNVMFTLS